MTGVPPEFEGMQNAEVFAEVVTRRPDFTLTANFPDATGVTALNYPPERAGVGAQATLFFADPDRSVRPGDTFASSYATGGANMALKNTLAFELSCHYKELVGTMQETNTEIVQRGDGHLLEKAKSTYLDAAQNSGLRIVGTLLLLVSMDRRRFYPAFAMPKAARLAVNSQIEVELGMPPSEDYGAQAAAAFMPSPSLMNTSIQGLLKLPE